MMDEGRFGMAFGLLGVGCSWTLSDVVFANLPAFMKCLPGGLLLPDQMGLATTISQFVSLGTWWAYTWLVTPPHRVYVWLIWACLTIELGGAILVALAWRGVLGDVAFVVLGVESLAASVGALSWAAIIPFISIRYPEKLVHFRPKRLLRGLTSIRLASPQSRRTRLAHCAPLGRPRPSSLAPPQGR